MTIPDDAQAVILVCSNARGVETAALVSALEQDPEGPGLAVALFEDLLPSPARTDPLSLFDTNVLATRLVAAMASVTAHPTLGALPLGCVGMGGGAAAAVIAASERADDVGALVLLKGSLVAASTSLPTLVAPTLYLRSPSDREDCAFLATAAGSKREVRNLPGPTARTAAGPTLASCQARLWFEHHLLALRRATGS